MKRFFSVLILALLVTVVSGLGGNGLSTRRLIPFAPAPVVAQSTPIAVSLPELAVITLNDGGERSGRVVGFDGQQRLLELQRGGDSASTPLDQIAKVVYDRGAPFYRAQGDPVIRGNQASPVGAPATWNNVPLSHFSMQDAARGQAALMLDSVLSSSELRGVQSVASSSTYVMDEMQFNLQDGTMTVIVTPY